MRPSKIHRIFITARTADRLLGLPGILCTICMTRTRGHESADIPIHIYAPPGTAGEPPLVCSRCPGPHPGVLLKEVDNSSHSKVCFRVCTGSWGSCAALARPPIVLARVMLRSPTRPHRSVAVALPRRLHIHGAAGERHLPGGARHRLRAGHGAADRGAAGAGALQPPGPHLPGPDAPGPVQPQRLPGRQPDQLHAHPGPCNAGQGASGEGRGAGARRAGGLPADEAARAGGSQQVGADRNHIAMARDYWVHGSLA